MRALLVPGGSAEMDSCLPRSLLARLHAVPGSSEPHEAGTPAA
jgi:hypothetical protein